MVIVAGLAGLLALALASCVLWPRHGEASSRLSEQPTVIVVQGEVYKDLIASQSASAEKKVYGAYVLDVDKRYAPYFSGLFSNNVPRVDFTTNNLVHPENFIIDAITKKAAKLFWANVGAISNNTAEVTAGWYAGPLASENLTYRLIFNGTNWVIIYRSPPGVS